MQELHKETRRLQSEVNSLLTRINSAAPPARPAPSKLAALGPAQSMPRHLISLSRTVDNCGLPEGDEVAESWSCQSCTFRNHPALFTCEVCEMPRIRVADPPPGFQSPFTASRARSPFAHCLLLATGVPFPIPNIVI